MAVALLVLLTCSFYHLADAAAKIVAAQSSGNYPNVEFYKIINSETTLGIEDAHCVHGIQTADGGYVCTGKFVHSGAKKGFVAKVNSKGVFQWKATFGTDGKHNGGNCIAEAPSSAGSYLLVAGFAHSSSDGIDRTLLKFSASGALVWTAQFSDPTSGLSGGFEFLQVLVNGDAVLGGFVDGAVNMELHFKSYGNVEGSKASLMLLPASAVNSNSAPSKAVATFDKVFASSITVKSVKRLSSGFIVATQYMDSDNQLPELYKLDKTGATTWTVKIPTQGEVTDVSVSADEKYYILSGHTSKKVNGFNTYDARFTRVSAVDGSVTWSTTHGIKDKLIYDECWGVLPVNDSIGEGVIAACGTGIEPGTCSNAALSSSEKSTCTSTGTGWKNLNLRLNAGDGSVVWQRVDQYTPDEPDSDYKPTSSASEYAALTSDGGMIVITDEAEGIGFLKFSGLSSGKSNPTVPTPSPTPAQADGSLISSSPHSLPLAVLFALQLLHVL
eukprot:TRINITY_DN29452_c0_g2_i1.p1 TRINITY_DN29452_c0_g2~~TRINITY_DN29452_c0_g2_i1.p1  ORF type:complete len:520 (-),score=48.39 TRINITY_DN29452_c0_g2_i1:212-1708(-)